MNGWRTLLVAVGGVLVVGRRSSRLNTPVGDGDATLIDIIGEDRRLRAQAGSAL